MLIKDIFQKKKYVEAGIPKTLGNKFFFENGKNHDSKFISNCFHFVFYRRITVILDGEKNPALIFHIIDQNAENLH